MSSTGTYRKYQDIKFKPESLALIGAANEIIEDYEAKGYSLSLRQLYYQMVTKNLLPNRQEHYDRLGKIISSGRLAGLVSWTAIEDRNRNLMGLRSYDGIDQLIDEATEGFRLDRWLNQRFRPEVWVEKAALESVVGTVCNQLHVDFFACRGYNSQSEQWRAGRRFARYIQRGQTPIVFHLGDHDPSGLDMTRDNRDRLSMFAGVPVQVVRLALNMPQIEQLKPPPNPAKVTDSRFEAYQRQYGDYSWELDALSPETIYQLIERAILDIRDQKAWDEMETQETDDRRRLYLILEQLGEDDV